MPKPRISKRIFERECLGKRSYDTEDDARKAIGGHRRRYGDVIDCYRCLFCRAWHLGHSSRSREK